MTAMKGIEFGDRFFWAYDVAAGVFIKHLINEAEASGHANEPWLSEALAKWRVEAAVTELGLTLDDNWSSAQRQIFIKLADAACQKLAERESIPAHEIVGWPLGLETRGADEVRTATVIEIGRAIIALVVGDLPKSPKGEAWFYGLPTGRSTIRMEPSWRGR